MASFNRVVLVGNLTKDIELRHTKNNTAVTDISIAVNERVKRNEQWVDEAHFFDITLCLLYTSPSPRDGLLSRMPSSA